ncbi:MAG TPA: plastocyanin/azurin family copper-binding protein [Ktedonobacteraceae bacterium]|nr:plastocyanin/azurin family copper-binding protein [Ktedonobacteraceae bacterium]
MEDNPPSKKRRHPRPYQPLSVYSKTFVVVLLIHIGLMIGLAIAVDQPVVLILAGFESLIVALTLFGLRWVMLLGSFLGGFMLFVFTTATSFPVHHLSHPKDAFGYNVLPAVSFLMFTVMITLFWCAAALLVTGVTAVIHNYFSRNRQTPSWFKTVMVGAICIWLGAFVLGALTQPEPSVAANSAPGTVHLQVGSFSQSSINLSKGDKLTLIDDGTYHHNISMGRWVNGQPKLQDQPGAPKVRNREINAAGASLVIGPFTTAGTYYLICSLHHNMMLKIIVK